MKSATVAALFFAASIALAIAYPARNYYYEDEYPEGKAVLAGRPISLASAPFFYQARTLELEPPRGRKYQIVKKKKKHPGGQGSDEDDAQDEEGSDESSEEDEEEDDENNETENNEEESLDVPPWEELFPEEDKNTGTFQDGQGPGGSYGGGQGGYGGQSGGSLADLPTGGPAPEGGSGGGGGGGGGFLSSLFGGGGSSGGQGPQSDLSGGPPPQYRHGPPPQYQSGPPPQYQSGSPPQYQSVRARTSMQSAEEPRSGGAVLFDGYRYIPVKPVHVRVPKRQAKKIKPTAKVTKVKAQARSLAPAAAAPKTSTRQTKKLNSNTNKKPRQQKPQYVLVPVERNNREIRFARDQHGLKMESGSFYAPSEVWRWEGPGGRPLRRRENRPSGLYYAPRPQRGSSSTIRFAEENDY